MARKQHWHRPCLNEPCAAEPGWWHEKIAMKPEFSPVSGPPKSFPARLADRIESFGVSPKKAMEYAAMILVLGIIYYCDLMHRHQQAACTPAEQIISLSELTLIFLKYFLCTAWPFAIVAACDSQWTNKDAGNVFLAGYVGANWVWFHHTGCGFCILAASFRTIPLVAGALLAHKLGSWRHRVRIKE